jgi:REP element-mobilizing transposase RayT
MEPGVTYHIFNHANGFENLFLEQENYRFFLQQYDIHVSPFVETIAFCLMPNHFHLMIKIKDRADILRKIELAEINDGEIERRISKAFSNFFSSYTQSYNKLFKRKGSLFVKNFRRKPITTQRQWQETFLYIHLNPVKHQFVKNEFLWKWSSLIAYKKWDSPSNIFRNEALIYFDGFSHIENLLNSKRDFLLDLDLD